MPQIEVRTRTRTTTRGGAEMVLQIILTPRGSGNRKLALGLAAAARKSELGPHIKRIRTGYSSVWIVLRPSLKLAKALFDIQARSLEAASSDVEGQIPLFGVPA